MPRRIQAPAVAPAERDLMEVEAEARWSWLAYYCRIGMHWPRDPEEEREIQNAEFYERFQAKVWALRDLGIPDEDRFARLYRWLCREGLQAKADRMLAHRLAQHHRHEAWRARNNQRRNAA